MDISAASALSTDTNTSAATTSLAENFDTFLKLLTAQMQNQDPLEPMDTEQFTEQLTQFSQVEQSITTNDQLGLLIDLTRAAGTGNAVSYLGQSIVADGSQASLQNGTATWNYNLARNSQDVKLTVFNSEDQPVFTTEGETGQGDHQFVWDGQLANGSQAPDGLYRLSVSAEDSAGNSIIAETTIRGKVTAIDFAGSEATLTVDGVAVPIASVREVRDDDPAT